MVDPEVQQFIDDKIAQSQTDALFDTSNTVFHTHNGIDSPTLTFPSSTTEPAGSNTEIQYNDNGVFGASPNFTFEIQSANDSYLTIGTVGHIAIIQTPSGTELDILTGPGDTNGDGGPIFISSGDGAGTRKAGDIAIEIGTGGATNSGNSGAIFLTGGYGGNGTANGGNIYVTPGSRASGTTANFNGEIQFLLSTSSPGHNNRFRILQRGPGISAPGSTYLLASITTTNGTAATYDIVDLSRDNSLSGCLLDAKVFAQRTGGAAGTTGDSAGYVRRALYKQVSGTTTLVGSVQDDFTSESQAGWDCTFTTSGNIIQLQVTGATNNTVSWIAEVEFVSTSSTI